MKTRKELKKLAKKNIKMHYALFVLICIVSSFLSSEFLGSNYIFRAREDIFPENSILSVDNVENRIGKIVPQEYIDEYNKNVNKIFGRQAGIFSNIINAVQSGKIHIKIIEGIESICHSRNVGISILIVLSLLLFLSVWYFVENVYKVILRRFFLEGRTYEKLSFNRFSFFIKIKKWNKVAFSMFVLTIYKLLWSMTIVGGIIKRYSYYLVPYIIAENPDIDAKDAIKLSRTMMRGYKFKCFILELSFFWWDLLGFLTLGITEILISNVYKVATYTEFYVEIRRISKNEKLHNIDLLNDKYLYEVASIETINLAYEDIIKDIKSQQENNIKEPTGIRGFFAKTFGVTTFSKQYNENYEITELKKQKEKVYKSIIEGKEYPIRLFQIKPTEKARRFERYNYLRWYSVESIILLFFIISFVGWLWEVAIHLVIDGRFVNRGMLHGPWTPIYGFGCIFILMLLYKFRKTPVKHFWLTLLTCGTLEYSTSYILEKMFNGTQWWNYTGYFINLNGRICAEGMLVFVIGGMAFVYMIAPIVDNVIKKVKKEILIPICIILITMFSIDFVYSLKNPNTGKGITDYAMIQIENITNKE